MSLFLLTAQSHGEDGASASAAAGAGGAAVSVAASSKDVARRMTERMDKELRLRPEQSAGAARMMDERVSRRVEIMRAMRDLDRSSAERLRDAIAPEHRQGLKEASARLRLSCGMDREEGREAAAEPSAGASDSREEARRMAERLERELKLAPPEAEKARRVTDEWAGKRRDLVARLRAVEKDSEEKLRGLLDEGQRQGYEAWAPRVRLSCGSAPAAADRASAIPGEDSGKD